MEIFNRTLLQIKKNNIASFYPEHNFLKIEAVEILLERLLDIKNSFENTLDIGCSMGEVANYIAKHHILSNKIKNIYQIDEFNHILDKNPYPNKILGSLEELNIDKKFDLIISVFSLHNVNNINKVFNKIYNLLNKNGLFICAIPTIGNFANLEEALIKTELELYNGYSPRFQPLLDITTIGNILQTNNFQEIIVDKEKLSIMYKDYMKIFKDLKYAGETNILTKQNKQILKKDFFKKIKNHLENSLDKETNHYEIKVEYCNLIGWKTQ
jgi:NADH dehydrogenase [ubiquinone] 1 alpha subcomplex assembly factor 5